jgi:LysR substrate binding domain-containing protein
VVAPPGFEYVDAANGETRILKMPGSVTVNGSDAHLAGLGIIQGPEIGVREHLANGALVEILLRHRAVAMPVSLLYSHRRQLPKRVQAFMNCLAEVMRQNAKKCSLAADPLSAKIGFNDIHRTSA